MELNLCFCCSSHKNHRNQKKHLNQPPWLWVKTVNLPRCQFFGGVKIFTCFLVNVFNFQVTIWNSSAKIMVKFATWSNVPIHKWFSSKTAKTVNCPISQNKNNGFQQPQPTNLSVGPTNLSEESISHHPSFRISLLGRSRRFTSSTGELSMWFWLVGLVVDVWNIDWLRLLRLLVGGLWLLVITVHRLGLVTW